MCDLKPGGIHMVSFVLYGLNLSSIAFILSSMTITEHEMTC